MISNPSLINQTKEMIIKGSPTAFTENVYQEMIQMEQIEDSRREAGAETEYSENYWGRMSQLALSDRALHAGALGVVGGPIQLALIQKPLMRKQLAAQKQQYDAQQDVIKTWGIGNSKFGNELIQTQLNTFKEFQLNHDRAIIEGDANSADLMNALGMSEQIADGHPSAS